MGFGVFQTPYPKPHTLNYDVSPLEGDGCHPQNRQCIPLVLWLESATEM